MTAKLDPNTQRELERLLKMVDQMHDRLVAVLRRSIIEPDDDSWDGPEEDAIRDEAEDPDYRVGEDEEDDSRTSDIDVVPL